MCKNFYGDDDYNDEYRNMKSVKRLFEWLKPIKTDDSFDGKKNSHIEYISKGDE